MGRGAGKRSSEHRSYIYLHSGRNWFDPWVGKIPWRREWQPTPVFLPREFHGERSLTGYSPSVCKESDTTEQLSTAQGNDISTQTGTNPWQNPGQDLRNPGSILCFKMQYQMLLLEGSSSQGYGFFLWSCMDVRVGL